jgi:hypothetical protein
MKWRRALQAVTQPTTPLVGVLLTPDKTGTDVFWEFCPLLRVDDLGPVRNNDNNTNLGRRTLKMATPLVEFSVTWALLTGQQTRFGNMHASGPVLVVPNPERATVCGDTTCRDCPLWFTCEGGHMPVAEITNLDIAEYHLKKRCCSPSTGAWVGTGHAVKSVGVSLASATRAVPSAHREYFLPHFIKD